jgi:hypothetical protein
MYALLIAVVVSASGDPYANCDIGMPCALEQIELTAGQKTAVVSHVLSQAEWSSITPSTIMQIECEFEPQVRCRPNIDDPDTAGSTIRAVLLAGQQWTPGISGQLVHGPWKNYAGANLTAITNHIHNVAPAIDGLPILHYIVGRTNGSGVFHALVGHKAVADAAWCAAHAGEVITPMGVVP